MKFTNQYNLPEPFYTALVRDTYRKEGHVSATGIIRPPQMAYLEAKHDDEIVVDAADQIWMLQGDSIHVVLERANVDNALQEERLRMKVRGWTVTGKPDLLEPDGTLSDYKVTSVFSFLLSDKLEWEQQLNIYAALYWAHGFDVKKLQIVGILRDWVERRAQVEADYPAKPVQVKAVPLWPHEQTATYIRERVELHQKALMDGIFPECSLRERWANREMWCAKKIKSDGTLIGSAGKGSLKDNRLSVEYWIAAEEEAHPPALAVKVKSEARAKKVFKPENYANLKQLKMAAEAHVEALKIAKGIDAEIEIRPGVRYEIEHRQANPFKRCEKYCRVSRWCEQYQGQFKAEIVARGEY
jgi:hypothetical protein